MPTFTPVEHDPFIEPADDSFDTRWGDTSSGFGDRWGNTPDTLSGRWGGLPSNTVRRESSNPGRTMRQVQANQHTGDVITDFLGKLVDYYKTPGDILQGKFTHEPNTPGVWSEQDQEAQNRGADQLVKRADGMALEALGMGTPFAERGAAGAFGGKLVQPSGIRAYHGSPHDFARFDLSKIGTGEGAQAYGHGLYFAENPAVAESYKQSGQLARAKSQNEAVAMAALRDAAGDAENAIAQLETDASRFNTGSPQYREHRAAIAMIRRGWSPQEVQGKMYEVNINAHPDQFLDWDKPLVQQSEHVRGVSEKAGLIEDPDITGSMLVRRLQNKIPYHEDRLQAGPIASKQLREAGIPGIKYLDEGSRAVADKTAAQELAVLRNELKIYGSDTYTKSRNPSMRQMGAENVAQIKEEISRLERAAVQPTPTRNYVLFRDDIIDILRKYGVAGLSVLPPALAAQARQQFVPVDHDPFAE